MIELAAATVWAYYQHGVKNNGELENANLFALQAIMNPESGVDFLLLYESISR